MCATPRARGWGASLQPTVTSLRSDNGALAALGRLRPPSLRSAVALAFIDVPSLRSVTFALPRCARSLPSLRSVTSLRSDVAALAALGRLRPPSLRSVVALASLGHSKLEKKCARCARTQRTSHVLHRFRCCSFSFSFFSTRFSAPRCARVATPFFLFSACTF